MMKPGSLAVKILGAPLRAILAIAIFVREIVATLGAPLWRLLARIEWLKALERWVATLPRWGVLVALVVPLVIAEPLKALGLYALALGWIGWGIALQIIGHAMSLLLVERILSAGKPQLMTYPWFATGWTWFDHYRAIVLALPIVITVRETARRVKAAIKGFLGRFAGV